MPRKLKETEVRTAVHPRRMPKQSRSRAMVDLILDATADVLIEHGYDRATTNRIAERAGVSIGSLYQYFPNKESLVAALNSRQGESELEAIRAKFEEYRDAPLSDTVRGLVAAMVESHRVQPELHRVLVEQVPRIGDVERIRAIDEEIKNMMRSYLQHRHVPADRLEVMVFVLFNVVETLTHHAVLFRPELLHGDRLTDEIASLVEAYISRRLMPFNGRTKRADLPIA